MFIKRNNSTITMAMKQEVKEQEYNNKDVQGLKNRISF